MSRTWPGRGPSVRQRCRRSHPNHGWIIKGTQDLLSGEIVYFGSRESGAPPMLLLELEPNCPNTPKAEPGVCGCGIPDTDTDDDGTPDCIDECPTDPLKAERGVCGCHVPETDMDADGIPDCIDPCPLDADPTLGGDCACPSSGPAPAGTFCTGVCGSGVCNGAGRCGDPISCSPDPSCGCTPYLTAQRIYWYCACDRDRGAASTACGTTPEQTLVHLETGGENAWVRSRITAPTWTGANDLTMAGTWRWADVSGNDGLRFWNGDETGSAHLGRFANWAEGEPSGSGQHCALLSESSGAWTSESCAESHHFFCERAHFRDSEPVVDMTCDLLGYNCDGGDWSQCVPESTAFPENDPLASLQACDACTSQCTGTDAECEAACASSCTGSAQPPPVGTALCPALDDFELPPGKEIHCALAEDAITTTLCGSSSECGFLHCGRAFRCEGCNPTQGPCPRCDDNIRCPGSEQCLAYKACGVPAPGCILNDVVESRCDETRICEVQFGEHSPDEPDPQDLAPAPFTPQDVFGDPDEPQQNVDEYPDDPPCPGGAPCPISDQHRWCHYTVDEGLQDRTPRTPTSSVDLGGNTPVTFSVSPDLNLNFRMAPGPLGLAMTRLSAGASFAASANVSILGLVQEPLDLIDLAVHIDGGVHPDLCGVKTDGTRAIVFGMDLLPGDFQGVQQPEDPDDAEACKKALADFQRVVDRAKKAFHDARILLEQYHALGDTENLQAICEAYVTSPPRGFPPPAVDCSIEPPEHTINRFIDFYVKTTEDVRAAAGELSAKLDDWFQLEARFPIGDGIREVEEISLLNQTFLIGPIPANLEVLLVISYGLDVHGVARFRTGELLQSLVGLPQGHNPDRGQDAFVHVGAEGRPNAGAGVSLFVGVGFNAGFASARAGIEGALELGHVTVPVEAKAGVTLGTSDDHDRALPAFMDGLVDEDAALLPRKKYHYGLTYDFGAKLQLRELLSGSISASLRVSFAFFSKSWRRRIVAFNGLCSRNNPQAWCDVSIFDRSDGIARGPWDWGTIQMPMPFLALQRLETTKPPGSVAFSEGAVGQFFYDSLCTCIPTWDGLTNEEQGQVDDCFRVEDCCDQSPGQACFHDPEDDRHKCTGCRSSGESCSENQECCAGVPFCVQPPAGGDLNGTCRRGDCNDPCNDDNDCVDGFSCEGHRCHGLGCIR
jgi:hypothetical protein